MARNSADYRPPQFAGGEAINASRWRPVSADHLLGEAFHLFELRAELQQQQIGSGIFELRDALGHLLRRSHQAGAQSAIGNRVIFERDSLLELGISQPLLVVLIAGGILLDVGNARELLPGLLLGI